MKEAVKLKKYLPVNFADLRRAVLMIFAGRRCDFVEKGCWIEREMPLIMLMPAKHSPYRK